MKIQEIRAWGFEGGLGQVPWWTEFVVWRKGGKKRCEMTNEWKNLCFHNLLLSFLSISLIINAFHWYFRIGNSCGKG